MAQSVDRLFSSLPKGADGSRSGTIPVIKDPEGGLSLLRLVPTVAKAPLFKENDSITLKTAKVTIKKTAKMIKEDQAIIEKEEERRQLGKNKKQHVYRKRSLGTTTTLNLSNGDEYVSAAQFPTDRYVLLTSYDNKIMLSVLPDVSERFEPATVKGKGLLASEEDAVNYHIDEQMKGEGQGRQTNQSKKRSMLSKMLGGEDDKEGANDVYSEKYKASSAKALMMSSVNEDTLDVSTSVVNEEGRVVMGGSNDARFGGGMKFGVNKVADTEGGGAGKDGKKTFLEMDDREMDRDGRAGRDTGYLFNDIDVDLDAELFDNNDDDMGDNNETMDDVELVEEVRKGGGEGGAEEFGIMMFMRLAKRRYIFVIFLLVAPPLDFLSPPLTHSSQIASDNSDDDDDEEEEDGEGGKSKTAYKKDYDDDIKKEKRKREDDEEEELNKRVKMTTDEKGRLLINDTTVVNTLYMEGGSMLATLLVKKFASKKDTDRKERGKKLLEILKKVAIKDGDRVTLKDHYRNGMF
ncbi:hypothetical protein TL16_g00770 [Triparma laevis f. inornata]|uniref:Uncharacterized protein n=1 Tax=Triparma laevis f. inornata TaxID=1714386 RepID=A0A9W6ZG31_9STRA|nr:hypothetical protein TL16_g00770 [Triparma laevis f. inornata]